MITSSDEGFFIDLCSRVGEVIKYYYASSYEIFSKNDRSPLTSADIESNKIIVEALRKKYPQVPIISEESRLFDYEERKHWHRFWLVDPLDGTKEFINRQDEFTVNIGLVENGKPVFGLVYVPVYDWIYMGLKGVGSWKIEKGNKRVIKPSTGFKEVLRVGISRFHLDNKTRAFLEKFKNKVNPLLCGSSLKFCYVAEGLLDLYLRFGPTWEWDTAAGQAVVEASGGSVFEPTGESLTYNKPSLKNGPFAVVGNFKDFENSELWAWIKANSTSSV